MNGMSSHELPNQGNSVEWFTPPEIKSLFQPYTDPCLPGLTDGLVTHWNDFVFLNPPYDRNIGKWLRRLAEHGNGVALIFARTETRHFFDYVWPCASGILFIKGRLHFYDLNGMRAKANAGAPSCLIAYGEEGLNRLSQCGIEGKLITMKPVSSSSNINISAIYGAVENNPMRSNSG